MISTERLRATLRRHGFEPREVVSLVEPDDVDAVVSVKFEVSSGTIAQTCDLVKGLLVGLGVDLSAPTVGLEARYDALTNEHRATVELTGVYDHMLKPEKIK